MRLRFLLFILAGMVSFHAAPGQGCSDAGFCTSGALEAPADTVTTPQMLTLLLPVGMGEDDVVVFTPALQYDYTFNSTWSVQAKFTLNYASGTLANAFGPGDLYVTGLYSFKHTSPGQWKLSLGTKLPLQDGNLKHKDQPLPMVYQSSLGTTDVILGVSWSNPTWFFSAGWQQPVSGSNGNQFLPSQWDTPSAEAYLPTRDFDRKGDVLLRITYQLTLRKNLSLQPGLLGIYHLGEDTYYDPATNRRTALAGSKGSTVNATVAVHWKTRKLTVGLTGGTPLATRDARPDGLTRSFVLLPEVQWRLY